ncbi:hypothetical protein ACFQLX_14100 [Streptomyces polyrhachis]|uniref:Uncharacterized protein n=1 Tax=Streptomyces polyrhachis TaxID=1282885 RepID=A0ABW2GFA6_9ACTN
MGIGLILDVLNNAPDALTHREKLLLVVLAEDANDSTRVTWNSVERPEVLRRAQVSRSQLYAAMKSLAAKGALEKLSSGQKNAVAKYRIPVFETGRHPGTTDTDVRSQRPGFRDVSIPESGTPTPPTPSSPTPAGQQNAAAPEQFDHGTPQAARPLVDGLTAAGIVVRWPFTGATWLPVLALIQRSGVPALIDHAVRAATRAPAPVDSARYFMRGWSELPPLGAERSRPYPEPGCPPAAAESSTPVRDRQQQATNDMFDRAMARAQARRAAREAQEAREGTSR